MQEKINTLKNILEEDQISHQDEVIKKYSTDWLGIYKSNPPLVLFPKSQKNITDIIQWAIESKTKLIPAGGLTGLSGASVAQNEEVIIAFERMNKIIEFNEIEQSLTLEPGVITQTIQEYAQEKNLYFPLSFASEGSSQIGGNVATNAGGVHVIKYGTLRKWILGMEVITGSAKKLYLGRGLIKNAAGYDIMNLFIGSEGTLGIITKIILQLTKKPNPTSVLLLAVPHLEALMKLYALFKSNIELNAFEMFTDLSVKYSQQNSSTPFPLKEKTQYYTLIEFNQNAQENALFLFESALENQYVIDGVMSESSRQVKELWAFRENISESIAPFSPYKNDISVRISSLPGFLSEMNQILKKEYPQFEVIWFGHIGDGNLHINILKPEQMKKQDFLEECKRVNEVLFSMINKYKGCISAEHGVGLLKKPYLHYSCSKEEINYMKSIKTMFDPHNLLNPGKVLD